jgi:uncharacterized protein YjbJ (UPF0337 family)
MDENRIEGAVKEGVGRVQDAFGGGFGDEGLQARGKLNEAAGGLQNVYGQIVDRAKDVLDDAADMIERQPYAAAGAAALLGLLAGLLIATRNND